MKKFSILCKNKVPLFLLLLILVGCSPAVKYEWIDTQEGYKIWTIRRPNISSYSWKGDCFERVINGRGTLVRIDSAGKRDSASVVAYYGSVNKEGMIEVSPSEHYIGNVKSSHYAGFGVLIKSNEIFVGNFENSRANGYLSMYKNGSILYHGNWLDHQFDGEGVLYNSDSDSIVGVWSKGKLIKALVRQQTTVGYYSGYVEKGKPNGMGALQYDSGLLYNGEWKEGVWKGEGVLSASTFEYNGEWCNNLPMGEGVITYKDGSFYDGSWYNGKYNGYGTALFSDGSMYIGGWKDNEESGYGIYVFYNGDRYSGIWIEGLQNGYGQYDADSFSYIGNWEEGWMNGEGYIKYANGDYYEGHFVENEKYGIGCYYYRNGNYYEGEFVDNTFNGLGIFHFNDSSIYEGEFLNGKIHGDGTYYVTIDGEYMAITANWDGSVDFPKQASILFANGDIYEGEIKNGKPTLNGVWYPAEKTSLIMDGLIAANDCYKLHKESIDKAIQITCISLTLVAIVASEVASAGSATPAVAAALSTAAKTMNIVNEVVNVVDVGLTVSSAMIDQNWEGVAEEVAVNALFIMAPKGINKVLKSSPARKAAVSLSNSAVTALRKSSIFISKQKPFKKIVNVGGGEKIKSTMISSSKRTLMRFSKSKMGRYLAEKRLTHRYLKDKRILQNYAKKHKFSVEKQESLLREMQENSGLAKLVRNNPEYNIKRWIKTRKHVDQYKLVRNAQGRFPINARIYAGNTYYFDPNLNNGLAARLKNGEGVILLKQPAITLTKKDLEELDCLYPDGVPFSVEGFPDFSGCAFRGKDGKAMVIDIGCLSGDSKKDINKAETIFQSMGYDWVDNYTWHHIQGTTKLIKVDRRVHQLVDHTGGMSMSKK